MKPLRDRVETVVLVMLKSRSFDHMLGHLSHEGLVAGVDGLSEPLTAYTNPFQGDVFHPFPMDDGPLPFGLPHEHHEIAEQLGFDAASGVCTMRGFVGSMARKIGRHPGPRPATMGFYPSTEVPVTSFLARSFAPCDRWFAPLPSGTQPNRSMAFCGASRVHDTRARLIACDDIVFDWLNRAGVRWRVYHDGFSFFAQYPRAWPHVLGSNFRDSEHLYFDMKTEPRETAPQVVIVEPTYDDAPRIGSDHPNDNHAPLAVGWGEEFLRRTYEAVRSNAERWEKTVMVVYYDDHGGFWDHVPPPRIPYTVATDPTMAFEHTGPRVPAIIVSPLVEAGVARHELFDHTSVLQLLAELFTPGRPYSPEVARRASHGVRSVSVALTLEHPREAPTPPAQPIEVRTALGDGIAVAPESGTARSFELAARRMLAEEPAAVALKYPELFHWRDAVEEARGE